VLRIACSGSAAAFGLTFWPRGTSAAVNKERRTNRAKERRTNRVNHTRDGCDQPMQVAYVHQSMLLSFVIMFANLLQKIIASQKMQHIAS
jgi:hypothetical protein